MTAIFTRERTLFRATEQAGGPWSPDMLQGSVRAAGRAGSGVQSQATAASAFRLAIGSNH